MNIKNMLNIEIRSKILEYSLIIEKAINDLLKYNLGLFVPNDNTRLFSNKGQISLQNKIDLLNDFGVLTKEEKLNFELLMIIRNKFMHDLECNSFQTLFAQLDNGIVNRFKKHLDEGGLISKEGDCLNACINLAIKNLKIIEKKMELQIMTNRKKVELFEIQNKQIDYYSDFTYELLKGITNVITKTRSNNPEVVSFKNELLKILEESSQKLDSETQTNIYENFLNSEVDLNSIFGIRKQNEN